MVGLQPKSIRTQGQISTSLIWNDPLSIPPWVVVGIVLFGDLARGARTTDEVGLFDDESL